MNDDIITRHELRVIFEQDANNSVSWRLEADQAVRSTEHLSHEDIAEYNAPLALHGIRVLSEILRENVIDLALARADVYGWRELWKNTQTRLDREAEQAEGLSDAVEAGAAVH